MLLLILCGCGRDKYSKQLIVKNLYSPYTAEADFVFSDGHTGSSGKIKITKSDTVTVVFTDSGEFSGITIKSDAVGNPDVFSFEFSGIPATVPKTITSDISLLFSLFSDDIPKKIETLEMDSFRICDSSDDDGFILAELFFTENNMNYHLSYDTERGIPHTLDAGNDSLSVCITFTDFRETTNNR